jgi:hypothetical protein
MLIFETHFTGKSSLVSEPASEISRDLLSPDIVSRRISYTPNDIDVILEEEINLRRKSTDLVVTLI